MFWDALFTNNNTDAAPPPPNTHAPTDGVCMSLIGSAKFMDGCMLGTSSSPFHQGSIAHKLWGFSSGGNYLLLPYPSQWQSQVFQIRPKWCWDGRSAWRFHPVSLVLQAAMQIIFSSKHYAISLCATTFSGLQYSPSSAHKNTLRT